MMEQQQPAADRDPRLDPALAARVLGEIEAEETIAFLQALVRVPSVNPPGDVRAAIRLCEEKLAGAGFATRVVGAAPEQPNLVATLRGAGDGPRLAFNAHVDVVPIGEESAWRHPPFGGERVDGRVYGRGAGDDKASVTAQVMAGVALARAGLPLRGALLVTTVADEETGGRLGAGYIVEGGHVEADCVIVGEQTLNRICVGERGGVGVGVVVYGATGHAAAPWEGVNAVEGMARVVTALREELWPALAARTHPFLPPSTATISTIEGGVKTNVIPDRCAIHLDRRVLPSEEPEEVVAEIRRVAERAVAGVPGLRVEVALKASRPAFESDPASPVACALQEATRFLGNEPVLTGFFAASDGKHFAPRGWPTMIVGPGDPATAHTPDEWVGEEEVLEATRLYALAALALLGGSV
jgi:succinyl-diaminopimelate desuccinylase